MNASTNQVETQTERGLLRFITAGSVDDGKSTLIGRLLFDSKGTVSYTHLTLPTIYSV